MVDIRELINYNAHIRHRYFEAFTTLPWEEFTKNLEASFYSLRDVFLNALNTVDYCLSFLQKEPHRLSLEFNDESFEAIQRYMEHV